MFRCACLWSVIVLQTQQVPQDFRRAWVRESEGLFRSSECWFSISKRAFSKAVPLGCQEAALLSLFSKESIACSSLFWGHYKFIIPRCCRTHFYLYGLCFENCVAWGLDEGSARREAIAKIKKWKNRFSLSQACHPKGFLLLFPPVKLHLLIRSCHWRWPIFQKPTTPERQGRR